MPSDTFNRSSRAVMLAAIAAAYPVVGLTAPAARVDFTTGNVMAISPSGQSRSLAKGAQVEQGETIATNNGRAHLRFTDGAYVSLQPESEFRIDQYRFDGKADGNEKGFFSLIKGGLRTITGLVGRTNKNNYQVTTSVATIGIRGTEYTIQYGQSITGTVGEGEINVCNGAGCLSVTNGESYYVQNQEIRPVLTNKRTDLPPPPPQEPPPQFKSAEQVNEEGQSCAIVSCGAPSMDRKINPANVSVAASGAEFGDVQFGTREGVGAEISGGGLSSHDWPFFDTVTLTNSKSAGDDGIIAWGTATAVAGGEFSQPFGGFTGVHWVVGDATSNMDSLSSKVGTYELLGGTAPTSVYGNPGNNKLTSMNMIADFGSGFVSGAMGWSLNGSSVAASYFGSISGGRLFASGSVTSGSGFVQMEGFFAGANASRAGVTYMLDTFSDRYVGAAALIQKSLTSVLIDGE